MFLNLSETQTPSPWKKIVQSWANPTPIRSWNFGVVDSITKNDICRWVFEAIFLELQYSFDLFLVMDYNRKILNKRRFSLKTFRPLCFIKHCFPLNNKKNWTTNILIHTTFTSITVSGHIFRRTQKFYIIKTLYYYINIV